MSIIFSSSYVTLFIVYSGNIEAQGGLHLWRPLASRSASNNIVFPQESGSASSNGAKDWCALY